MRHLCVSLLILSALLVVDGVHATVIIPPPPDPDMSIDLGGTSTPVGNKFMFTAPTGNDTLDFLNNGGVDWNSLRVITHLVPGIDFMTGSTQNYNCNTTAFPICNVTFDPLTGIVTYFFGSDGIANQQDFIITLRNWDAGHLFSAAANGLTPDPLVPEPATAILLLTTAGPLLARRKLREAFAQLARAVF